MSLATELRDARLLLPDGSEPTSAYEMAQVLRSWLSSRGVSAQVVRGYQDRRVASPTWWVALDDGRVVDGLLRRVLPAAEARAAGFHPAAEVESPLVEALHRRKTSAGSVEATPKLAADQDPVFTALASKAYSALLSYGVILDERLGCGMWGCAYQTSPRVVKFTREESEAANAHRLMGHNQPGLIPIRAVLAFKGLDGVYAIITDRGSPLDPSESTWIHNPAGSRLKSPRTFDDMARFYRDQWDDFVLQTREYARTVFGHDRYVDDLAGAIAYMAHRGIWYGDLHSGNVMAREINGERHLSIIDFGHSIGPMEVRIPEIETDMKHPAVSGVVEPSKRKATFVQSLLFPRGTYSPREAVQWAQTHKGFRGATPDITENYVRIRQVDPSTCRVVGTITLPNTRGPIQATVAVAR